MLEQPSRILGTASLWHRRWTSSHNTMQFAVNSSDRRFLTAGVVSPASPTTFLVSSAVYASAVEDNFSSEGKDPA